jgi:hypothetical protein
VAISQIWLWSNDDKVAEAATSATQSASSATTATQKQLKQLKRLLKRLLKQLRRLLVPQQLPQLLRNATARASSRPIFAVDFANSRFWDTRLTFTRSGGDIATYIDKLGILRTAKGNQPRFTHDL